MNLELRQNLKPFLMALFALGVVTTSYGQASDVSGTLVNTGDGGGEIPTSPGTSTGDPAFDILMIRALTQDLHRSSKACLEAVQVYLSNSRAWWLLSPAQDLADDSRSLNLEVQKDLMDPERAKRLYKRYKNQKQDVDRQLQGLLGRNKDYQHLHEILQRLNLTFLNEK